MQLIMSPTSPFVRKIRVQVRETNLTDVVEEIAVANTPLAPSPVAAAANPLGKIPALIRDEGPTLYDSRVIARYLDDYATANLYPTSRVWEVLTLEATADGMMDAAVAMAYEGRLRPPEKQSAEMVEAQWLKVAQSLDAITTRWMSHLSGPLTASQIAVGCALSYLDFRHDARSWRTGRKELADWHAEFAARDSMKNTQPT